MLKFLRPVSILMIAACAPAPDDLPPVDPLPGSVEAQKIDVVRVEDDAGIVHEPYNPDKEQTLIPCGAHETLDLVGQPITASRPRLPDTVRVILPGNAVTQDYNASRMNVFVNDSGLVTKINCG